jgi:hypothetical protein
MRGGGAVFAAMGCGLACHAGEPLDWGVVDTLLDRDASQLMPGAKSDEVPDSADAGRAGTQTSLDANVAPIVNVTTPSPIVPAPLGTACEAPEQCQSGHCSNGICCDRSCTECEVCSSTGQCAPLAACMDATCDAGVCMPASSLLGLACDADQECASGFCADGVCCESACDGLCQQCGAAGYCDAFPQVDPGCAAVSCPVDTSCRAYLPPGAGECSAFGRCASAESCVAELAPVRSPCGENLFCDAEGECRLESGGVLAESTQTCPASGAGPTEVRVLLEAAKLDCWAGPSWELGATMASGQLTTGADGIGWVVSAYVYGDARSAKTQAYDETGALLPGCVAVDNTPDRQWVHNEFDGVTCRGVAFALLTAHSSLTGDL